MTDHPAAAPRRTLMTRGVWITIVAVILAIVATIVGVSKAQCPAAGTNSLRTRTLCAASA
jgi:hypothetical protein